MAEHERGPGGVPVDVAFPTLSARDLERLAAYGTVREVAAGEQLFVPGDREYDFFVIIDATVAIVQREGSGERVIATHGAGRFLGELNMLTGSQLMVAGRVDEPGRVIQIPFRELRRVLDREVDLGRTIVDAFLARRAILQAGPGARVLQVLGSRFSPEALRLRQYLARVQLPHTWVDLEDQTDVDALLSGVGVQPQDTPVVIAPTGVMRRPTPGELAEALGLAFEPAPGDVFDIAVVGAGPAGLGAAVYAASEGLRTLVLDTAGPGGQAGTSSRIENYLGFPSGISGRELTDRAVTQAQKFGARITSPCEVVSLKSKCEAHYLTLHTGDVIAARALVVATGARYRRLPVDNWADFEGAGIYYAATDLEARVCDGQPVAVIGGGNSAGQAALFLADHAAQVQILVRRDSLKETMSRYLVERIDAHPRIALRPRTEVAAVHGEEVLGSIDLVTGGEQRTSQKCSGLFCFIGAEAATGWLPSEVRLDGAGFVLTDRDLRRAEELAGEDGPLPFESSVPGVFAVGDARHGSTKRVAGAVGEGAAAVRSAHRYLAGATVGDSTRG